MLKQGLTLRKLELTRPLLKGINKNVIGLMKNELSG